MVQPFNGFDTFLSYHKPFKASLLMTDGTILFYSGLHIRKTLLWDGGKHR